MRILIFGATGATGRQLVAQSLAAGHDVTAFARTPSKMSTTHPRLRVVQGDVLDEASVDAAMPGHDVVMIALGTRLTGDDKTISLGTDHVLAAMRKHGVQRLIVESAWGTGDSSRYGGFLLNRIVRPLLLKHPYEEHELQERAVATSDVDWTVVRPGRLTNGAKSRTLRGSRTPQGLKQKASRAEVAAFMIGEAEHPAHSREAILIG
jgi:putative NADH-flavin reductase